MTYAFKKPRQQAAIIFATQIGRDRAGCFVERPNGDAGRRRKQSSFGQAPHQFSSQGVKRSGLRLRNCIAHIDTD